MSSLTTPGQRLTYARIKAGYEDQRQFADAVGVPQPTYNLHETGKRGIRPKVAEKYAAHLKNCTPAWLLYGDGTPPAQAAGVVSTGAEDAAAFLVLYDRITALSDDNSKAARGQAGVILSHYGYDAGQRGVAQLAFHLWQECHEEGGSATITERVLKKLEWLDRVFDALKESLRKMDALFGERVSKH